MNRLSAPSPDDLRRIAADLDPESDASWALRKAAWMLELSYRETRILRDAEAERRRIYVGQRLWCETCEGLFLPDEGRMLGDEFYCEEHANDQENASDDERYAS